MTNQNAAEKTIKLYSKSGWKSLFAKIRFWDAPYIEIEQILPKKGTIIDLGCGEGLLSNFIALSSDNRSVYGIELNKSRIKDANHGVENTKFVHGDITKAKVPDSVDAIIIVHVLHHLESYEAQELLLRKCKSKLNKSGKLIVVEIDPKFSLKYFITWLTDHFLVPILFEKKLYSPIYFRKGREWKNLLSSLGFDVSVQSVEEGKPFTHIILNCKK